MLSTKNLPLTTAYRKTAPEFIGPLPITKVFYATDNYTVPLLDELHIHNTFHIKHLKTYIPNDNKTFSNRKNTKPGPLPEFEDENRYEVERIVGEKGNPRTGEVLYYVKWKGWGHQSNTWEPAENIDPEVIEEFYIRMKASVPAASTTKTVNKTKNQRRNKKTIRE